MKTMTKSLLIALTLVLISSASMFAQELGTTGLYQNGSDHNGTVAYENTDSVTIGSTMQYYVQPSPAISPLYVYTSPKSNLNSSFVWTAAPAASGSITSPMNGTVLTNWISINWTALGAVNLSVVETATTGGCAGSTTTIPVLVIHAPTITGGVAPAAQCATNPSTVSFTVPFTLTSDVLAPSTVRVNYTVYNPDNSVLIAAQDVELAKAATTINVPLTGAAQYGAYKVTFNTVSDRISRKSSVNGTVTTANVLLTVNPVPTTGPIYHLPNL